MHGGLVDRSASGFRVEHNCRADLRADGAVSHQGMRQGIGSHSVDLHSGGRVESGFFIVQ
jgi:hypothetical protein